MRILDFNKKQNPNINLTIYSLNDQKQIISIGEFKNKYEAMDYFNSIISENYVFPKVMRNDSKTFVISAKNYSLFFQDKDIEKYESFFNEKYKN